MTTVADILDVLEALAPTGMKMDWDNVGLLCGSRKKEVEQVLVALDPFEDVCDEAVEWGADVIVTHHPLIFRPVANVTDETSVGRIIERLCSAGICAVNAHTNLDCAPGGVNDELAAVLGLHDVAVLNPSGTDAQGRPWGLLRGGETDEQPLLGCARPRAESHRRRAFLHREPRDARAGRCAGEGLPGYFRKNLRNPHRLHEICLIFGLWNAKII